MDAMMRIARAAEGLLYSSEADYPLEPFVWSAATPFSPDALAAYAGLPPDTPVTPVAPAAFFAPMMRRASAVTPEAQQRARRFRSLLRALRTILKDLAVYKVGAVEMPTYIIGRLEDGTFAGLRTTVVET